MACCMAEKYGNWCEKEQTRPIDGKEYCIFHAPIESKHLFNTTVSEAVTRKLNYHDNEYANCQYNEASAAPEPCIFEGAIFPDVYFAFEFPPMNPIILSFKDCTFHGDSNFGNSTYNYIKISGCTFKGDVNFDYSTIEDELKIENSFFLDKTKTISMSDITVKGQTNIIGRKFEAQLIINNSKLNEVKIAKNTFENDVDFSFSNFNGQLQIIKSNFNGDLQFLDSIFRGPVYFMETPCEHNASFANTTFYAPANFCNIDFKDLLEFTETTFKNTIFFNKIQATGPATFDDATFEKKATFLNTGFYCETSFNGAKSHNRIEFNNSILANADFNAMTFKEPATFKEVTFKEETKFKDTRFEHYVNFEEVIFDGNARFENTFFREWAYFREIHFNKHASFKGALCTNSIIIESSDLRNMALNKTNIESFRFISCKWGDKKFEAVKDERESENILENIGELEDIYRRLKKSAKDGTDELQTSHWHYKEKEMQRKAVNSESSILSTLFCITAAVLACGHILATLGCSSFIALFMLAAWIIFNLKLNWKEIRNNDWFSKIYLNIYYAISGYGEKPLWAAGWLLAFIMLPVAIDGLIPDTSSVTDSLTPALPSVTDDFSYRNYLPLLKPLGESEPYQAIWQLVITLQATLFAFALRNKLRR